MIDKAADDFSNLSLISFDKNSIEIDGLYSKIFKLPQSLFENIKRLEKHYLLNGIYDKNFDFYQFKFNEENESELPELIVKELKSGILNKNLKKIEDKLVLSGLFLKLFEKYELDKKHISSSFASIQKKEQELFNSLRNNKNEKFIIPEKINNKISPDLIEKQIKSWLDFYFYLDFPSFNLITDKIENINILLENGFKLESQGLDSKGFNTWILSFDLEYLNNKNLVFQSKSQIFDHKKGKLKIKVVR
ncbi:MAG: hypothetical protein RBR53_07605 [Desulforegulaceae bacterium]|nr:hypothetical protein [Desulforegulaceae bacterium]